MKIEIKCISYNIWIFSEKKKPIENNVNQVLTENNQANNKTGFNESYQSLNIQLNESIAYIQKQECQVNIKIILILK